MTKDKKSGSILEMVFALKKKCEEMDDVIMKDLNLHQSELQFFTIIDSCCDINSSELGKQMGLSPSRISRIIDKLVNNGYLERNIADNDRRAITLKLTNNGKVVKKRINETRHHCESKLLSTLSDEESTLFGVILGKIQETL